MTNRSDDHVDANARIEQLRHHWERFSSLNAEDVKFLFDHITVLNASLDMAVGALTDESPDENVRVVRAKLLQRSTIGLQKYLSTTHGANLPETDWLIHLQEELMDAAIYIEESLRQRSYGDD